MSLPTDGKNISSLATLTDLTADGKYLIVQTSAGAKLLPAAEVLDWLRVIQSDTLPTKIDTLLKLANGTYEGRDLTTLFADEIADYSDEWAWIKARITAGNYEGMNLFDYIPLTFKGETHDMQIATFGGYKGTLSTNLGNHIDFISRDCVSTKVQWNTTNTNNGDSADAAPYMVCNLKDVLDEWAESLPTALLNVITEKTMLMETRYSSSGTLTDSTGWEWANLGKLWVPTVFEVFGDVSFTTKGLGEGQTMQYPIFANSWKARIKDAGPGGGRCHWWLASVPSGNSTHACIVNCHGYANYTYASDTYRVPLCFRISA